MELLARLAAPQRETKVVGLVCTGHFFSHFYLLVIPPLFPILREIYGVGFTELGFATAAFAVASGFTQIPVGFLVDKYGARMILIWGMLWEAVAFMLIAIFPFYGALLALMVVGGLANSVFHPADYAILNATVDKSRIGRVFSFHTFTGYLGDALAPATVLFLTALFDWRVAVFLCGAGGAVMAGLMWMNVDLLNDAQNAAAGAARAKRADAGAKGRRAGLALIFSLPIVMGMLFFASMSTSGSALRTFGVSTLHELYAMPLGTAGMLISAYLFAAPVGVLVGGLAADRIHRHDLVAAFCIIVMAACIASIAAFDPPLAVIAVLLVIAGFANGFLAPPRDMLIRALAPPSEIGKVFGFVSSGFAVSGIIAPVMYGWILDHSSARNVLWVSAAVALLTIATVLATGRQGRRIPQP
jgi:FSR family fosmidomycin resistance protein-like MFS transporter